jgi:hypothetical protein
VTKRKNMFLVDQMIMMSSLNKTVTHEVRFWCYFTETTVHRTRVWSRTHYTDSKSTSLWSFSLPDPPCQADIFLFVYICIVIVDPIFKKAEGGDPILLYTAWYMFVPVPSQELDFHRHTLWSFFQSFEKRCSCLFCWYWWIFISITV